VNRNHNRNMGRRFGRKAQWEGHQSRAKMTLYKSAWARQDGAPALVRALAEDFEKHGAEVIAKLRVHYPSKYIRLCEALLLVEPREAPAPVPARSPEEEEARRAEIARKLALLEAEEEGHG
jgi:hypothetical protein